MKQHLKGYLLATLCTALFSTAYEQFSHEVYSPFMILAFLIPLGGGLICFTLYKLGMLPNTLSLHLMNFGLAFFTFGSLFMGVLEIYGTTNGLIIFYPIAGGILILLGILANFVPKLSAS